MKIAGINGSPKYSGSSSGLILRELKDALSGHEFTEISVHSPEITEELKTQLLDCGAVVFAFPLYVDSIPSHLIEVLQQMEKMWKDAHSDKMVYAVVNCGFYEGSQNRIALNMMKCWCRKAGLSWGQGLGIGGGGMIPMIADIPEGKGIKKEFSRGILEIAENIAGGHRAEDRFISPGIPRIMYKLAGQMGWRKQIRKNGLPVKELSRKLSQ
ncbi:NAD(P)H-dependent oxidoreductase [Anaerostipes sp.]|uniref:NAD(P)H-dependent oxidoreductase n=1 Tax=Anaerostipes sp. TaxID=1872530 RepID=UPI0025BA18DD|nr:NAD(P)H-dependent oxidoreductase [Anaerostipes sp.]MBS7006830.1 NAD(P)H-dependent oxidoreductase [Anaerostipes sp.]